MALWTLSLAQKARWNLRCVAPYSELSEAWLKTTIKLAMHDVHSWCIEDQGHTDWTWL